MWRPSPMHSGWCTVLKDNVNSFEKGKMAGPGGCNQIRPELRWQRPHANSQSASVLGRRRQRRSSGTLVVIYGSATGLNATATPADLWHLNVSGINDTAQPGDRFGLRSIEGTFSINSFVVTTSPPLSRLRRNKVRGGTVEYQFFVGHSSQV